MKKSPALRLRHTDGSPALAKARTEEAAPRCASSVTAAVRCPALRLGHFDDSLALRLRHGRVDLVLHLLSSPSLADIFIFRGSEVMPVASAVEGGTLPQALAR